MDPGQVQAVDRGPDRDRPGPDDQAVIAELALAALDGDSDLLGGGVDRLGGVVQQQPDAGLKLGKATATTTVASTEESSSRARRAAAIPASLPPITSSRILTLPRSATRRG
jgi:hypothetical protein